MNYRIDILKVLISAQIVDRGAAGCGFDRHADSSLFNESYLYAACFLTFKKNARGLLVLITEAQSPGLNYIFIIMRLLLPSHLVLGLILQLCAPDSGARSH